MNLLTKLTKKFKALGYKISDATQALLNKIHINGNNKIVKKFGTLALCGVMAFSIATMTACNNNNPDVGPSTTTEQPSDQTGDNDELKQYSQILQTVLTDDYYTNLADAAMSNSVNVMQYSSIPYTFLQKQGHDVNAVKNGDLNAGAVYYTLKDDPTALYCKTTVGNQYNDTKYNTQYTLKYKISTQEINDLVMLMKGKYVQAALFLQELDRSKKAEVISCVNIDPSTYNAISSLCSRSEILSNTLNSKVNSVTVTDFYQNEDGTYSANIQVGTLPHNTVGNGQLGNAIVEFERSAKVVTDNNILLARNPNNIGINYKNYNDSLQDVVSYYFSPNNFNKYVINK